LACVHLLIDDFLDDQKEAKEIEDANNSGISEEIFNKMVRELKLTRLFKSFALLFGAGIVILITAIGPKHSH
jgi:hypothetical protein